MNKKRNWRKVLALTEEELLDREQHVKNQAKIIQIIKDLPNLNNVDTEVDENRIHMLWNGKNEGEFIDVFFDKSGKVLFTNDETPFPMELDIGLFMGEELYRYVITHGENN